MLVETSKPERKSRSRTICWADIPVRFFKGPVRQEFPTYVFAGQLVASTTSKRASKRLASNSWRPANYTNTI